MEHIDKLESFEKLYILNILKEDKIPYTKNNNGYFFNMTNISSILVEKISKCLTYIVKNKKELQRLESDRKYTINSYKNCIQESLKLKTVKENIDYVNSISQKSICNVFLNIQRKIEKTPDADFLFVNYNKQVTDSLKNHPLYFKMYSRTSKKKYNETEVVVHEEDNYDLYEEDDDNISNLDCDLEEYASYEHENTDNEDKTETWESNSIKYNLKSKMDFYRNLLMEKGYVFRKGNHDILVKQEYM